MSGPSLTVQLLSSVDSASRAARDAFFALGFAFGGALDPRARLRRAAPASSDDSPSLSSGALFFFVQR